MSSATTRLLSLLASVAVFIVAIVIFVVLVIPTYQQTNVIRGELASLRASVGDQEQINADVAGILAQFQSIASVQQTISLALPTQQASPTLLHQLTGLAQVAGVQLTSVQLGMVPPPLGEQVLMITQAHIELSGSYESFVQFISSLERNIRLMDIVQLDVTAPQSAQNNYTYRLVVQAYHIQ